MFTDEVTSSVAVRPKCDTEANETNGKEIWNNAVRPKSDMDAEVLEEDAKNEQEHENAAAAKNTWSSWWGVKERCGEQKAYWRKKKHFQRWETTIERFEQTDKKMHQRQTRMEQKRQEKIQRILKDFKGFKNIPSMKSAKKEEHSSLREKWIRRSIRQMRLKTT